MRIFSLFFLFVITCANVQANSNDSNRVFESLLDTHWQSTLKNSPTFATSLGVRDFDDKLSNVSVTAIQQRNQENQRFLTRLNQIDIHTLNEKNQLNWELFHQQLTQSINEAQFTGQYILFNNRSGPHLDLTSLPSRLPFFTLADYQSYVARLSAMPEYLHQAQNTIRHGLRAGWNHSCVAMKGYEQSIEQHIVNTAEKSVFHQPFAKKPTIINATAFSKLEQKAKQLIQKKIVPAFTDYLQFYLKEIQSSCTKTFGVNKLPKGDAYYAQRVKHFTTTDQTPEQVHNVGLQEVKRIKQEMHTVMKDAGFTASFADWLVYLRDNNAFYPKTAQERLQVAATISKKMDGELPKLFGKLPRMPYGIKPIPLDIAEKTTTAYYLRPAGDGTRSGTYYVNTTLLNTRPLYQLEALSLHEAVPGHHLQLALSQELDLPNFRKYGGQTVFVEGWAFYAERLGLEVGFYQTPYTNFGRLSYEMWRACRLVVDTGIHHKGWNRQQAITYMAENSGLSLNNITSEVDRYITWPGQALAYKTGEMKIRELRKKAEDQLQEKFDIRAFHDAVLENGAIPLSSLERIINRWIQQQNR